MAAVLSKIILLTIYCKKTCNLFLIIPPLNNNKEEVFISEHQKSQFEIITTEYHSMAKVLFSKQNLEPILLNLEEFITINGMKAQRNQLIAGII